MSSTNPYEILNVASDADSATIQKAFKDLSLKLHPDKANVSTIPLDGIETETEREAREQFNHEQYVKIVEARDTLLDAAKRRDYDEQERNKKKESTHEASDPGDPSKADNLDSLIVRSQLNHVEWVSGKLTDRLSEFRQLAPDSPDSEYADTLSLCSLVLAGMTKIIDGLKVFEERFRDTKTAWEIHEEWESATKEAESYTRQVEMLNEKAYKIVHWRDRSCPLKNLYYDLAPLFRQFISRFRKSASSSLRSALY
ncbi:hypothetical protein F4680DRAFT_454575 [Xylaria scruposa]|nr:hypothetical protein F4680DRAFT_454575 [Xylaria scruposa]